MNKLAIFGGEKSCPDDFPKWPFYQSDEILAAEKVLRSGMVNQWSAENVKQFEAVCSKKFNQPHGVAVFNGTLALELILRAFEIGAGDEVIVTPRSFFASVSSVVMVGATPVFADIDERSQNISSRSIEPLISERTKAIIPVHLNGWPCDMADIMKLAKKHNIVVIEDCAQAHGAMIDNQPVGSFGDGAAFSFCQDKIISSGGEGGMALFSDENKWKKAWGFKDHGKDYDAVFHKQHSPGLRWVHESFGSNWRMTNIQAAIGIEQSKKLENWVNKRNEIAKKLTNCLNEFSFISTPKPSHNIKHAYYRFSFHVDEMKLKPDWSRIKILQALVAEGVECLESCSRIYKEKAFEKLNFPTPDCPIAKKLENEILHIKIHHRLRNKDVGQICLAMKKVLVEAGA